jgi:NADPH:quinone reductase
LIWRKPGPIGILGAKRRRETKMRAMQVTELGAPLVPADLACPEPGPGEVLLRVHACGLNVADTLMVAGKYQEKPPLPFVPGMELCGTVVACGAGVDAPAPGTRVAAYSGGGGLAEFSAVPAARCVAVPDAMPDAEVAGFLVAYGTSAIALGPCAGLAPGETLLVTGASGGVGLTAVELGKLMGARVIAVARGPAKLAVAAKAGADHLFDSDADIRTEVRALGGADVVYDTVGGALFDASLRATNPFGRILPIGFAGGAVPQIPANILLVKNLTVIGLYWGAYVAHRPEAMAASLAQLFDWYAAGRLHPHVSHVLPLEAANEGLDLLRTRKATGKVVIVLDAAR